MSVRLGKLLVVLALMISLTRFGWANNNPLGGTWNSRSDGKGITMIVPFDAGETFKVTSSNPSNGNTRTLTCRWVKLGHQFRSDEAMFTLDENDPNHMVSVQFKNGNTIQWWRK